MKKAILVIIVILIASSCGRYSADKSQKLHVSISDASRELSIPFHAAYLLRGDRRDNDGDSWSFLGTKKYQKLINTSKISNAMDVNVEVNNLSFSQQYRIAVLGFTFTHEGWNLLSDVANTTSQFNAIGFVDSFRYDTLKKLDFGPLSTDLNFSLDPSSTAEVISTHTVSVDCDDLKNLNDLDVYVIQKLKLRSGVAGTMLVWTKQTCKTGKVKNWNIPVVKAWNGVNSKIRVCYDNSGTVTEPGQLLASSSSIKRIACETNLIMTGGANTINCNSTGLTDVSERCYELLESATSDVEEVSEPM